jgi:hypothetical protein
MQTNHVVVSLTIKSVADWLAHEAGRIWIPTDTVKGTFDGTFQHRKNLVMKHSPSAM